MNQHESQTIINHCKASAAGSIPLKTLSPRCITFSRRQVATIINEQTILNRKPTLEFLDRMNVCIIFTTIPKGFRTVAI